MTPLSNRDVPGWFQSLSQSSAQGTLMQQNHLIHPYLSTARLLYCFSGLDEASSMLQQLILDATTQLSI